MQGSRNKNKKFVKKAPNKGYDRKRSNRPDVREEADSSQIDHKYNDVSWYTKNDQMLRDAASLSYNSPVGTSYPQLIEGAILNDDFSNVVPSMCKLKIMMSPGLASNQASPANLAANNIYAYVRYMNSGAKNYDQPDLMLYLLAMDSIYAQWNYMKRLYGMARFFSQYNRTVPVTFFPTQTIYNEIYSNLADYRLWLNKMAAQISSFCVPSVMPLFVRHSWMFSNIYKDSNSYKAQMYMFEPAIFYKYEEKASKFGGSLSAHDVSVMTSLADLKSSLEDNVTAVSYSEDIGIMSGDILKAYGQDKLFKLAPVDEDYSVEPVYNEEVLNQIHNSRILPVALDGANTASANITQDPNTGFLIWGKQFGARNSSIIAPKALMINMPWDDVTPANTMVGTRLTTAYSVDEEFKLTITAMGTEAVVERSYLVYDPVKGKMDTTYMYSDQLIAEMGKNSSVGAALELLKLSSNFDWHPIINLGGLLNGNIAEVGPVGDINNYTVVSADQIQKIHDTAVMSLFNIPQLGSF